MARLMRSHFKTLTLTLSLAGRGKKSPLLSEERARVRSRPFTVLRRVWRLSLAGLACLMVAPALAHAHGGMAGPEELGPPIATSGLLGFVCYWLVMLWPAAKKKGNPEVGSSRQNKYAPRTQGRSLKKSVHVKQVSRLRKIERNGQFGSDQHSGRKAIDG